MAGVVALTGALLLTSAPVASADYIRDRQWMLDQFSAKEVWAQSQGQGVTVAVVDTGVDGSHPDLTGQVLEGKDFTGNGNAQEDVYGHGTSMASIIAGHGHGEGDASGVMGLAPKAKILPLRYGATRDDDFPEERWAAAVKYAVDHGATVVNMSLSNTFGFTGHEGKEALAYAQAHDVIVVAGAGNDGLSVDDPAALPGVVAVSAIDKDGEFWSGSNAGKEVVLSAPGVDVVGADPTKANGYANGTGTSASTAYVSAAAALVRSKFPDLTAGQVINRLIKSATLLDHKVGNVPDEEYGYGMIRPYSALTMDIPKGPKQGPLGKISLPAPPPSSGEGQDSGSPAKKIFSSGSIIVIASIAAVVVVVGIVFALVRSRRNRSDGGGASPGGVDYPNQPPYPSGQQPYHTAAPGQSPHNPSGNPYGQQPPYQEQ
ncbi:type VII secretion-associated serine protease mycosin [Streptomyces sp. ISL-96]|nr:type VII secretion-associated serine protease mycosin [Streptomyces sp. ISL-96]